MQKNRIKGVGLSLLLMTGFSLAANAQTSAEKLNDDVQTKVAEISASYKSELGAKQLFAEQNKAALYMLLLEEKDNRSKAEKLAEKLVDADFELKNIRMEIRQKIDEVIPISERIMPCRIPDADFLEAPFPRKGKVMPFENPHFGMCEPSNMAPQDKMTPMAKHHGEFQRKPAMENKQPIANEAVKAIKSKYEVERNDLRKAQFSEEKLKAALNERKALQKQLMTLQIEEFYEILNALPEDDRAGYRMREAKQIALDCMRERKGEKRFGEGKPGMMNNERPPFTQRR